ncbi:hypothetical protein [Sphaerisporangium sp. NPDC051011]|uniref:hypothetical protein n=1 Tax=Sphaerisporangium sp. NPDC051011 TaxID=3155792 RepID=UPI0033CBD848
MSQVNTKGDGGRAGALPPRRRLHLERLARDMEALAGIPAVIVQGSPAGPAHLHVGGDPAAGVSGDVSCDLVSGDWWFIWADGEPIAPAHDPYAAALAIARILEVRT